VAPRFLPGPQSADRAANASRPHPPLLKVQPHIRPRAPRPRRRQQRPQPLLPGRAGDRRRARRPRSAVPRSVRPCSWPSWASCW